MELELWRGALQRHVARAEDRARRREAADSSPGARGSDYGLEELSELSRALASHFAAVSQLVHDVFEAARGPLDGERALEAAGEDPARVVACARVVEVHDRLQRTRLKRVAASSSAGVEG